MMPELYLYACELTENVLSEGQKRAGQRVGAYLAREKIQIDRVLYHNADVYEAFAHKLTKAMGKGAHLAKGVAMGNWPAAIANAGKSNKTVLVIGPHDKFGDGSSGLPADTLICLENPRSLDDPGKWSIKASIACEDLPQLFAFPFPDGHQLRPRPAYYYFQSAVIPFQKTDQGLQVMVIGSSKRKHFVVPKGIHEPGLSAQESAAKESLEEAGVMGPVSEGAIGSYTYPKWGAECTVTVYAQRVVEILPEPQWQERHRGRQWMAPNEAAAVVKQSELGEMIKRLKPFLREELK